MKLTGRLQLALWNARLRLRESAFLRRLVTLLRKISADTRQKHLRHEVQFWKKWVRTAGLSWQDEFRERFDSSTPLQDYVAAVVEAMPGERVEILDVGAGPATSLGKTHPSKEIVITATDALAVQYNAMLASLNEKPPVPTIYAEAEFLRRELGSKTFDIVHSRNALDHSADAVKGLKEMLAVTRPGGFVVLLHKENEGRNERYHALHKWDFRCERGHFIISGPGPIGPRHDITEMLSGTATVECAMSSGEVLVRIRKAEETGTA